MRTTFELIEGYFEIDSWFVFKQDFDTGSYIISQEPVRINFLTHYLKERLK
jgi:hypothetical protein